MLLRYWNLFIRLLVLSIFVSGCATRQRIPQCIVTLILRSADVPAGGDVYLTGSTEQLGGWNPAAIRFERYGNGEWRHSFLAGKGTSFEFKITRGSWKTEAVALDGQEMPNFTVMPSADTVITISIFKWRDKSDAVPVISSERMKRKGGRIELSDDWKFQPGDSICWADPSVNDRDWQNISPDLLAEAGIPQGWNGRGWFRLRLRVDSSMWGRPLAFAFRQAGASEIYLNGRRLYSEGVLPSAQSPEIDHEERLPKIIAFDRLDTQIIAVRYANARLAWFQRLGYEGGFGIVLLPEFPVIRDVAETIRFESTFQAFFATVAAGLTILYVLLFLFDRTQRAAISLGLLMGGIAFLAIMNYVSAFVVYSRFDAILGQIAAGLVVPFMGIFGLTTGIRIVGCRFPRRGFAYCVAAALIAIWSSVDRSAIVGWLVFAMIVIPSLEWIWLIRRAMVLSRDDSSIWRRPVIIGIGATLFVLGVILELLMNAGVLTRFIPVSPYYLGFMFFAIALSVHYAYGTAHNARALQQKLREVADLSQRTLEQERLAHQEELRTKIIEADNFRKTKELDDARSLQLSMLPKEIPKLPFAEIAVSMATASEVGGDYYDFRLDDDGGVIVAVGDATGHGLRAGIMVATMKGLFTSAKQLSDFPAFFESSTGVFKKMHLGNLFMSLTLAKIVPDKITCSAAGMPSVMIRRAADGNVQQLVSKGMPLGAHEGFPYTVAESSLCEGDCIVFVSDGFVELFNPAGEQLDSHRLIRYLQECNACTAQALVDGLLLKANEWAGNRPHEDDMTLLVVKLRNSNV